ncbi:MAG: hypothetical protein ACK4K9_06850 [Bacteroidia bacterium]
MKTQKLSSILFFIAFLISSNLFAQKQLYGKWKLECVFERIDNGSISTCDICPKSMSDDKSMLTFHDLTIEINKQEIKFTHNKSTEVSSYEYDSKNEQIKFTYSGNEYVFKLLKTNNKKIQILKSRSGCLVLLSK